MSYTALDYNQTRWKEAAKIVTFERFRLLLGAFVSLTMLLYNAAEHEWKVYIHGIGPVRSDRIEFWLKCRTFV